MSTIQERPANPAQPDARLTAPELEEREVRAHDPLLSAAANERLTHELRAIIGSSRVLVPADRPHVSAGEPEPEAERRTRMSPLVLSGMVTAGTALVLAGVVAMTGTSWWLLPIVVLALFATVALTVLVTIRLTTITEHPAPDVAAALAEAGALSPDERFSAMVAEFRSEPERGVGDVASEARNEREVAANTDPSRAAAEQSSAWTPTSQPSAPTTRTNPVDLVLGGTALVLGLLSIVIPAAFGGGAMWILTAIVLPLVAVALFALRRAPS